MKKQDTNQSVKHMHVRKGDTVMVIRGEDAHKSDGKGAKSATGKVISASPRNGTVIVEGVNMRYRHRKSRQQNQPSARIEKEMPIAVSNVMLYCTKCNKPTRISYRVEGGKKVRVCKNEKCGKDLG